MESGGFRREIGFRGGSGGFRSGVVGLGVKSGRFRGGDW